ncbi:MAG: Crp/Fnr family transcriptional regulator [Fibrobacter sp.]|jgi:CRP/FNR family transcriptional regulator/CRP/FNR family cyclic AMP-dependent transcriptional regulator|nr:Crp/Fnr family transcriptional regulator [Fibrobacter sp.]
MADSSVIDLLRGIELFSGLQDEQLEELSAFMTVKDFFEGETIIREGDDSQQALFLVASGAVKVFMTGSDGRETILSLLGRGDFFGEMSIIDGGVRSASVKAISETKLLLLPRDHFLDLLQTTPELSQAMLLEMARRLRKANRQIGALSTMSVSGRVLATLRSLIEERGVRLHSKGGVPVTVIRNRPTQQQLAEMSGTTRETVSRVISGLSKKKAVSIEGKDLFIMDENSLNKGSED